MSLDLDSALGFAGMFATIAAAGYLFFATDNKKVAALLVIGFCLHLQSALYISFVGSAFGDGGCWPEKSFYQCMPLEAKVSLHAAQLGHFLIALALLLMARASRAAARS